MTDSDVGRKWKIGVVDEKILEIFNFSLPCTPHCNMNFAEPKDCVLNEERQIISMVFDIKSTQSNVSIMNADPFTLTRGTMGAQLYALLAIMALRMLFTIKS
jgi:hypothetical protein